MNFLDDEGLKRFQALVEKRLLQRRLQAKIGGVISLKSLWSATCPEKLAKIKGHTAVVKARELENGFIYLFIEIPFVNGEYEELRVGESDLEEGDEVDIFSIIAIFIDKGNGDTVVRYDAKYVDEDNSFYPEDVKSDIIHRCSDLMTGVTPVEMSIKVTYEGGECKKIQYGVISGNNSIILYLPYSTKGTPYFLKNWHIYDKSNPWYTIKIVGYRNAQPLTHGLILAESVESKFDILNADGSVLCKDLNMLDYGPDYLICNSRLWWYNIKSNLWEEKVFNPYSLNDFSQRMDKVNLSLKKIQFASDIYFYIYECEFWGERLIGDDDNPEWEPGYATSFMGLIDNNGSWVIPAAESVKEINRCHSIIIVNCENSVTLYDSKRKARGLFKEIITIDKCEIKYGKYLLLMKDSLQGVYNAETESMEIPCCIDGKYTLKPNTIGNGMIGVSSIVDKKRGKHSWQEKKCYYLDYHGNVVLEINDGWVINSGFKDGKAIISMTDNYHGNYYERTIDIHGKVLEEEYESFPGEIEEYQRDDMRNLDRDNWDAMTDGQYGDYPDEGFDGDYEFMGR